MKTKIFAGGCAVALAMGGAGYLALRQEPSGVREQAASPVLERTRTEGNHRVIQSPWKPLLDDSLPLEERLELARSIPTTLSSDEIDFLFESLDRQPAVGNQGPWWVVMNEVMEQMRKKGVGTDQYSDRMIHIISDREAPEVARDYAIQHLGQWISPAMPNGSPGESDTDRISKALTTITDAIKDPSLAHTSIPGTGLLTLADALPRMDAGVANSAWEQLASLMTEVIEGRTSVPIALRTSVIQVAARSGRESFLPLIRNLITERGQNPSILLSSVAALGIFRQEADRPLLTQLAQAHGPYQYAAKSALESLELPNLPAAR